MKVEGVWGWGGVVGVGVESETHESLGFLQYLQENHLPDSRSKAWMSGCPRMSSDHFFSAMFTTNTKGHKESLEPQLP